MATSQGYDHRCSSKLAIEKLTYSIQANILIDDDGRARLVDFGLSSIKAQFAGTSYWTSTAGGAIRWRAPELLPPWPMEEGSDLNDFVPNLTVACDIFSFGCVMLHVSCCASLTSNFCAEFQNVRPCLASCRISTFRANARPL